MAFDPVFGESRFQPDIQKVEAKGNLVRTTVKIILRTVTGPEMDRMKLELSAGALKLLVDPPLSSAWVPFQPVMDLFKGVVQGPFKGDVSKVRPFAQQIAREDLSSVYKVLLKMLSGPSFLVNRIGTVHDMYARGVTLKGETVAPGHGMITLDKGLLPYYYCGFGVCGWIDAALEIYRAKNTLVKHSTCRHKGDAQCQWEAHWD